MSTASRPRPVISPTLKRATLGVYVSFFTGGFVFANWASRMPTIQGDLGVGMGQLGLILLFTSFGSIIAMPFAGAIVTRLGITPTLRLFAALNLLGYVGAVIAVSAGSPVLAAAALFVSGLGMGPWDVSMNLAGTVVERERGASIMPRFHALWSFGTVAGAGIGAIAAALHLGLVPHLAVIAAICLVAMVVVTAWLLPVGAPEGQDASAPKVRAARAWLEPRTLIIGLIVLSAALAEGSANDWISIGFVKDLHQPAWMGALGMAVFLVAMTTMRLFGTGLIDRHGRVVVLRICYSLAAIGLLVYVLAPWLWLAFVGVAIWGLGAAIGFPVGMSAASDDPVRAASRVSVVSTIGYTAFIAGPPLLGMLGDAIGPRHAMLAVLVPAFAGLLLAGVAAPRRTDPGPGGPNRAHG